MNLLVTSTHTPQAYSTIRALRPHAEKIVASTYRIDALFGRLSHAAFSRLVMCFAFHKKRLRNFRINARFARQLWNRTQMGINEPWLCLEVARHFKVAIFVPPHRDVIDQAFQEAFPNITLCKARSFEELAR